MAGNEVGESSAPRRFRLIELLVVIVVIVIGLCVLLPAIQEAREAGRRCSCLSNNNQFGLAIANYASTNANAFPPSAEVITSPSGQKTVGGYSLFVKLLPFMEYNSLYMSLPATIPNGDIDAALPGNPALAAAMNTQLKDLICPSNPNKTFQNPRASPPQFALTNYKAMGASTRDSLFLAGDPAAKPPYGTAKMHPDGALFPGDARTLPSIAAVKDGTSHTIVTMETMDDTNSRWVAGAECTLVGLPQASSPTGDQPAPPNAFYAPPGFDGKFGEGSGVARAGLRTFLEYNFSPNGADAGTYEDPGWAKAPPAYGPSSAHPGVVNVSFADGSDMGLSKQVDAANLFFLITKDNHDPFNIP